jgi:cyclopropane fatty-acyl-phospholipid synthase-like methyltransferase
MRTDHESSRSDYEARWEAIYRGGAQLNLYPQDHAVSWFSARCQDADSRAGVRVLDLGCGAGNNLWFPARAVFSWVYDVPV